MPRLPKIPNIPNALKKVIPRKADNTPGQEGNSAEGSAAPQPSAAEVPSADRASTAAAIPTPADAPGPDRAPGTESVSAGTAASAPTAPTAPAAPSGTDRPAGRWKLSRAGRPAGSHKPAKEKAGRGHRAGKSHRRSGMPKIPKIQVPAFWKRRGGQGGRLRCTALVPAAGSSSRMGGENKLLLPLNGAPVLVRTLTSLQLSRRVDEIIVAARVDDLMEISRLCKEYHITKCTQVVTGGETRAHSVLLAAMEASRSSALLAVHDGARPLVTPELVDAVIETAARTGAAAPAIAVKDTIKRVKEGGAVEETLDRSALRAVQTPQVFEADLLKGALQSAIENRVEVTDDCAAVERIGKVVFLTEGEEENLKITTPADMVLARAILQERMNGG